MLKKSDYSNFLEFLSLFLGADTEVVLYDLEKVVGVENPSSKDHGIGSPLGEMEALFLNEKRHEQSNHVMNYRSLTSNGEKLRSATYFIRGDDGELEGFITVNKKVKDLMAVRDLVNDLINGEHSDDPVIEQDRHKYFEAFNNSSFEDLMNNVISENIARIGVPSERLRPEEKLDIVRRLDEMGTFLIKGSVTEVATKLHTSEATIYRYLNQLTT